MLLNFQKQVVVSQSPTEIAYTECISSLKKQKNFGGFGFVDLLKEICKNNLQIADYLGYPRKSLQIKINHKSRKICYKLLNNSHVKKINEHPIALKWFDNYDNNNESDLSDSGDSNKIPNEKKFDKKNEFFNESGQEPMSSTSPMSPSDNNEDKEETITGFQFSKNGRIYRTTEEYYRELKGEGG
jgi:hypothetical protein